MYQTVVLSAKSGHKVTVNITGGELENLKKLLGSGDVIITVKER